jgi:drug/metabolite transporter (DMT)-like permease
MHTTWNSIAKRCDTGPAFFAISTSVSVALFVPLVPFCWPLIIALPANFWAVFALTVASQTAYFYFLGKGYSCGELSVVYPIARSYPIIVVTAVGFMFGQSPTLPALAGVIMVVAGCFMVQIRRFSEWNVRRFLHMAGLFALLAACGSAGYSICDKYNMGIMVQTNAALAQPVNAAVVPMCYNWLINAPLALTLFAIALRNPARIRETARCFRGRAALVGILTFAAYALVLAAMQFVANVSYVVAFRQVSILLTVSVGVFMLGEERNAPKIVGALVMFAGLLLVGIYGR